MKKGFVEFLCSIMIISVFSVGLSDGMTRVCASNYREEVVKLAASQVGYHEKETREDLYDFTANSGKNNFNKYANDLWLANGVPWGAVFFWWVMLNSCVPPKAYPQSMTVTRTWFEERGLWREKKEYIPEPGDYILLANENKCGIVEEVKENTVTYIAANIEDESIGDTNCVARITCPLDDPYIDGYGLIDYDYNKPPEGIDFGESFCALIVRENTSKRVRNTGTDAVLWDEKDQADFKWLFTRQSDGTYIIRSLYDSKLLTVEGAGTVNGTNVTVLERQEGADASQKWYFTPLWGGYQMIPQHIPHFAMDYANYYDNTNGLSLKLYCASQSATQLFVLSKIDYYPLEDISISGNNKENMCIGDSRQLVHSFVPENASANMVIWSSSDSSVAEVDSNGCVTAKKKGTVTVSCTSTYDPGISDSVSIFVDDKEEETTEEDTEKTTDTEKPTEEVTEKPTNTEKPTEEVTEKPIEEDIEKPTDMEKPVWTVTEQKNKVKKGTRIKDRFCYYEITSVKDKKVKVVEIRNKKTTVLQIPDKVKHEGKTYQITAVEKNAFRNNKKLKRVAIGNRVKIIGEGAFAGCTKLNKIVIGKNVTLIGQKAFYGCRKLKQIQIRSAKLKKIGKNAFKKISKKPVVWAPKKKIKAYKDLFKGKF